MKKIIWSLLILLGIAVAVSGCARWPDGPGPGPGKPAYQLKITVEVKGEINTDDGIYYIALDTDENSADGPDYNVEDWENDFYYVKFDSTGVYFSRVEEGSASISLTDSSSSEKTLQVTIAVSDLGSPSSIDINVLTTDPGNNTYDYLEPYFTIYTDLGSSMNKPDSRSDSGEGGADFDIVKVTALITTQ
ncbi:MAG TPA: hypothetical protein DEG96_02655 [Candidatus Atribacteria bacterium]|nr:hypothetical protein [Candidatus Atribacteria bacterium]